MTTNLDASRYGDLCRLCAAKTTLVLGINIFENEGSSRQIRKKIETCLPVHVDQSDALPKMVCENCLYKLDMLFDFRERSVRTEKLLQDLVKELNENTQQQSLSFIPMNHNNLIMIPHNHLNNIELDLSHHNDIIVGHGIILPQTQQLDLSNLDLQTQEAMLMENTSHTLHNTQFSDLMNQQQLLHEQFNIRHDLINIDMTNVTSTNNNNNSMGLMEKEKTEDFNKNSKKLIDQLNYHQDQSLQNCESSSSSDKNSYVKSESLSLHEDSNSTENQLLIDEGFGVSDNADKVFLLQDQTALLNMNNTSNCVYCNVCNTQFPDKQTCDEHYTTHFDKCEEILNDHLKEFQGILEEMKPIKVRLKQAAEENSDIKDECDTELIEEDEDDDDVPKLSEPEKTEDNKSKKKWSPKVCTECGKSYKTNYKLNEHMRKHTGEKPYKCNSCEKSFRSKIGLAQHEAKHTGQYEFSCPTCGKGFQCRSYLMVHQKVHSDIKPWPCSTCGASFKTKQSLQDHTNRHLGVKPFICDVCGRAFITKGLCKAHQKIHTGLDNRKYSCKICEKMFVSKSYLQTHLKIHTGEKPFICEVCGKGFLTRVDLRIHSTLHTGEKSYVCEICGKAFARRDALRCHRRSHTGERPYSCEICGQTFTQFTPMAIHKRLHTGERPYKCETCSKTFVSRSTMMAHAKKHKT